MRGYKSTKGPLRMASPKTPKMPKVRAMVKSAMKAPGKAMVMVAHKMK